MRIVICYLFVIYVFLYFQVLNSLIRHSGHHNCHMNVNDDFLILSLLQLCLLAVLQKRYRRKRWLKRRWWVRPINVARPIYGDYEHLFHELKYNDPDIFFRFVRMREESFNLLLEMTKPFLTKFSKRAFSPEQRLTITLRYLFILSCSIKCKNETNMCVVCYFCKYFMVVSCFIYISRVFFFQVLINWRSNIIHCTGFQMWRINCPENNT